MINYKPLVAEHKWKELLKALPIGHTVVKFPDLNSINSFSFSAYDFNSDGRDYTFSLNVDKTNLMVRINKRKNALHKK